MIILKKLNSNKGITKKDILTFCMEEFYNLMDTDVYKLIKSIPTIKISLDLHIWRKS
mgnify:CR=1 FL=1